MRLQRVTQSLAVAVLVALMLATTVVTAAAAPGNRKAGVFGEVVATDDGGILEVRTKRGVVRVQITEDTRYRSRDDAQANAGDINAGDRIGASGVFEGDLLIAEIIMVIPPKASTVHITGVVTEVTDGTADIVTEDGRRIPVEFGLNRSVPAPGTVVTVIGRLDPETGVLRARGLQRLDQTVERLIDHLDKIQDIVPSSRLQIRHIARLQHLLERASERHIEILERVVPRLPEEARPAMEKALHNLDEANKAALQGFKQTLRIVEEAGGQERGRRGDPAIRIPEEVEPSLYDIAGILGLSEDALIDRMGQGVSLSDIAREVGLTEAAVKEEVFALVRDRTDRLIAEGELDSADAEAIIAKIRREAGRYLLRVVSHDETRAEGVPFSTEDLANILDMEPTELVARLHQQRSLVEVARERGLSKQQLLDRMMELARARAESLIGQGAMREEDAKRFLRGFREEIGVRIVERQGRRAGDGNEVPITPKDIAVILGMTEQEYYEHFEGGGTLAELADLRGVSVNELTDKIEGKARLRLERRAETGEISRDEARRLTVEVRERVVQELRGPTTRPIARPEQTALQLSNVPFNLDEVAEVLNLSIEELRALMSQGQTALELARERDIPLEVIVLRLTAAMSDKIADMVDAGRIDEDRGQNLLANAREGVRRALENYRVLPPGEEHPNSRGTRLAASFRPFPDIALTIEDLAQILGVSVDELVGRLEERDDFHDFLVERGFAVEEYVAAVLELVESRLKESVGRRELTQEKVGMILQRLKRRLLDDIGGHPVAQPITVRPDASTGRSTVTIRAFPFNLGQIAGILGLSPDEVMRLLSEGHTMAEVADSAGVSLEELAKGLIGPLEDKLLRLASTGQLSDEEARRTLNEARIATLRRLKDFRVSPAERIELSEDRSTVTISDQPVRVYDDGHEADGVRGGSGGPGHGVSSNEALVNREHLLPSLGSVDDVYRILGVAEQAAELRGQGLSPGHVAEELGYSRAVMHDKLLNVAQDLVFGSDSAPDEMARELLARYEHQVQKWVEVIFADVRDPSPEDVAAADIENILPRLDSVEDVWRALGVLEKAAELHGRGLSQAQVARELGFSGVAIHQHLLDHAEEVVARATRSGSLSSEEGKQFLTRYARLADEWVAVIFKGEPRQAASDTGTGDHASTNANKIEASGEDNKLETSLTAPTRG